MKAQSAIEYLITYGWMLVAMAVISSTIYSVVGNQCVDSSTGFQSNSIQLSDFAKTGDNSDLSLVLENTRSQGINISEVEISTSDETRVVDMNQTVNSRDEEVVAIPGFRNSEGCSTLDLQIRYSLGSLEGQYISGEVTSNIEFSDVESPQPLISVSSSY